MAAVLTTMSMPPNSRMVRRTASSRLGKELKSTPVDAANSGARSGAGLLRDFFGAGFVEIGDEQMRALAGEEKSDFPSNAAGAADNQSDLAAELRFRGHALEFGFFESPIFDAESFGARKSDVIVKVRELPGLLGAASLRQRMGDFAVFESVGAGHHVNGVDEELCGDARFFFVFAKAEESDSGNNHYGRIGIAELRANRPWPILHSIFCIPRDSR